MIQNPTATITGTRKDTGEKVEILYRVRSTSIAFQYYKVDGDTKSVSVYERYLKSIIE